MRSLHGTSAANGRRAITMAGRVLFDGAVTVLRQPGGLGGRHWIIRYASCGHEQTVEGWTLRHNDKNGLGPPVCKTCLGELRTCTVCLKELPSSRFYRSGTGYQSRCKACDNRTRGERMKTIPSCGVRLDPDRVFARPRVARVVCRECCDLPHRRPVDAPCPLCGEAYAPEKLPTIVDVLARPRDAERELV